MKSEISRELLIIGGGPAGLKAGQEAAAQGIDYEILEKGKPGQAWREIRPDMKFLSPCLPQRDWTSLNPKFPIWKMKVERPYCTAAEFVTYLDAFSDHYKLNIAENTPVVSISQNEGIFRVQTSEGMSYSAPLLLVATGIFGNPFFPEIPGIRQNPFVMHSHNYMGRQPFERKKVLIVGAGNSAAETAIDLAGWSMVYMVSRKELQFFSDTKRLYHIRGISESYLKELISMEIIRYRAFQEILRVEENQVFFRDWKLAVDKIIFATGYHANLSLLNSFKLRVNKNNYPEVSLSGESLQYPNLFFAGPLALHSASSIVIHGFIRTIKPTIERIAHRLKNEGGTIPGLDKRSDDR